MLKPQICMFCIFWMYITAGGGMCVRFSCLFQCHRYFKTVSKIFTREQKILKFNRKQKADIKFNNFRNTLLKQREFSEKTRLGVNCFSLWKWSHRNIVDRAQGKRLAFPSPTLSWISQKCCLQLHASLSASLPSLFLTLFSTFGSGLKERKIKNCLFLKIT